MLHDATRPRRLALAIAATATLALASTAMAVDLYVAPPPAGSDSNDGLTPATPWATLQHAADEVAAGDTVHVADGSYTGFDLRTSGTASLPITFLAEGSAVEIVADNPVTPDGINVENASHVVIDGFRVFGRTRAAIRAALCGHVTVRNCTAGNNGVWGIFTGFCDDLLIENNETFGSIDEHGIYVSNSGDRPVIRGNHTHDNHAQGIHMNGDVSLGGDGLISNALVESNVVHGNGTGGGSAINMDGVTDSVFRNNLIYDQHASGMSLYRIDGATGSTNNLVVNNTVVVASDGRWAININNGSTGNTVLNNILHTSHSFRGAITIDPSSRTGFTSNHNSVMDRFSLDGGSSVVNLATWRAEGYDLDSFVAAPADHFLVPGADFRLLPTSPAIDAGTATLAPGFDLDGGARPVGAGYDIGAYESQLPDCGDGSADTGEVCGEPSLPACADPCTTCLGCVCAAPDPVCGDALVCGAEECEVDGDCGGGLVCQGCACVNPPACTSGIELERAKMKLRASPGSLLVGAEAVIPKPWVAVDPAAAGIRLVIDAASGSGGVDATLPGGARWKTNGSATTWTYADPAGSVAGITKAVVKDRSRVEDGRLKVVVKGKGSALDLPSVDSARTSLQLGDTDECASLAWGAPGDPSPSCSGGDASMSCR